MILRTDTAAVSVGSWFVIWTESRAEKKVEKRITALGLLSWLPLVKERHRWSDRWREVECPLFPGYLFARATPADLPSVLRTPGVLSVIRHGNKPAVLGDEFVAQLRDAIGRNGSTPEPLNDAIDYAPGDEVEVQEGALVGIRGIVQERRSGRQLVLWVAAIGRGVAFSIGSALVKAVGNRTGDVEVKS